MGPQPAFITIQTHSMPPLFETVVDLQRQADVICRRRYGMIEVVDGEFRRVRLRPYPKLISLPGIRFADWLLHRRRQGDCCRLFYNQPRRCSNFLAVVYVVSHVGASFRTVRTAGLVLDEIAKIKRSDALLCDASNRRISDRLLHRWGWQAHSPSLWRRNFIKRFYGEYPT